MIRVILADDHLLIRECLRGLLLRDSDISIVAEASHGEEAVRLVHQHVPDIIIMDISMPHLNGIEATRRIGESLLPTKVIVLSMHTDRRFVERTLQAGARGYVLKHAAFQELVETIRKVVKGKTHISRKIVDSIIDSPGTSSGKRPPRGSVPLTERQRSILQKIALGKPNKAIADELHISMKMVEKHRHRLTEKLKLYSIASLTKYAIREGIISLDEESS